MPGIKHKEYKFISDDDKVAEITATAKEFCREAGFSESHLIEIELGLTEAINNIIEHSYCDKNGYPIEFHLTEYEDRVRFLFIDCGKSNKNKNKKEFDYDPEDIDNLPEGGMGLFIIEQVMDESQYDTISGRNFLKLIKYKKLV